MCRFCITSSSVSIITGDLQLSSGRTIKEALLLLLLLLLFTALLFSTFVATATAGLEGVTLPLAGLPLVEVDRGLV